MPLRIKTEETTISSYPFTAGPKWTSLSLNRCMNNLDRCNMTDLDGQHRARTSLGDHWWIPNCSSCWISSIRITWGWGDSRWVATPADNTILMNFLGIMKISPTTLSIIGSRLLKLPMRRHPFMVRGSISTLLGQPQGHPETTHLCVVDVWCTLQ